MTTETDLRPRASTAPAACPPAGRILGLACRNCGRPEPLGPSYVCAGVLRAARRRVRPRRRRRDPTPRGDRGAAAGHLALPRAAPGRRAARARPARRIDAARRRGPARSGARRRPPVGQGRHAQPDRCRSRTAPWRSRRRARRRFGIDTLACASTGNLAGATAAAAAAIGHARLRVHPGGPRAGEGRARARLRRDRRPDRRHVRRRQPALPPGRRRDRLGLRQRQPPAVLRRGQQDPRVRDRRGPRLADARRHRGADRLRRDVHEARARVRPARRRSGSIERRPIRFVGGQAAGLRAGRDGVGVRRRPRSSPSGRRTRSSGRSRSATRPTGATRSSSRVATDGSIEAIADEATATGDPAARRARGHLHRDRRRA